MATEILLTAVKLADITNPYALVATELVAAYVGNRIDQKLFAKHGPTPPDAVASRSEYGLGKRMWWGRVQVTGNQIEGLDKPQNRRHNAIVTAVLHSLGRCKRGPTLQKIITSSNKYPYDHTLTTNDLKYGTTGPNGLMFYTGSQIAPDPNWADWNSGTHPLASGGSTLPDSTPAYSGSAAGGDEVSVSIWSWRIDKRYGGSTPDLIYQVATSAITLDMVLKDVCEEYGLIDGDHFDFSDWSTVKIYDPADESNFPDGWVWEDGVTGIAFIGMLAQYYNFDLVEIAGQLRAVSLGGAPSFTLSSDIGFKADDKSSYDKPYKQNIVNDLAQLPAFTFLEYQSLELQGQRGSQAGRHLGAPSTTKATLSFPILTTDSRAAAQAQTLNDIAWIQIGDLTTGLSFSQHPGTCSDVVTVLVDGETLRGRITRIERDPLGVVTWTIAPDDTAVLTQTGDLGSQSGSGDSGSPEVVVPSTAIVFSDPDIRDADVAKPRVYIGACGSGPDANRWSSAFAYMKRAGGTDWVSLGSIDAPAIIGTSVAGLSAAGAVAGAFDVTNTVNVVLLGASDVVLAGTTEDAAKSLGNYAWLQRGANSGELIAFAGAAFIGSATWTLSDILRGLRHSVMTGHAAADQFCLLDAVQSTVYEFDVPVDAEGETVTIRVVSDGQDISDVGVFETTVTIASPATNAAPPAAVTVSGPIWWHQDVYRMCRADYGSGLVAGTTFKWETNLSGAGWVSLAQTGAVIFTGWSPGQSMQIRVTAIAPNGSTAGPISTANLAYIEPHILGNLFPVTVIDTVTDYQGAGWTLVGNFLTAPANGVLAAIDGFSGWSVGSAGVLPSRILIAQAAGHKWNGAWDVAQIGDSTHPTKLTRSAQAQQVTDFVRSQIIGIQYGTVYGGSIWMETSDAPGTINVDPITYQFVGGIGVATLGSLAAYLKKDGTTPLTADWDVGAVELLNLEDPTAAQSAATKHYVDTALAVHHEDWFVGDGSIVAFTLSHSADAGTRQVFVGGQLMKPNTGSTYDYSLTATALTLTTAPELGIYIVAYYTAAS